MQFRDACGKQIRLCYLIFIIVLAIILFVPGVLFSSMIIKSDGKANPYIACAIPFEKPVSPENETVYNLSDVTFDKIFAQQNSNVLTVDKNVGGDYTTIQEAINNAPDMATIFVKAGIYTEVIDIKKSVKLIGEDNVIINPVSRKNSYAIRVCAPGTKLSKFSITNGAPGPYASGVYVSVSNTEIEDCDIYDTPIGIAIWTSNNIINNCNFWGCKDEGIALLGSSYSECNNNEITNCIFHDNCDGIELQYSSNNIITNCEFYNNTHTGIDAIASFNDKNTISDCIIYNNKVNGIYLSSSSDNQIMDCSISNNKCGNIITTGNSHDNKIASEKDTKNSVSNAISDIKLKNYIASCFFYVFDWSLRW